MNKQEMLHFDPNINRYIIHSIKGQLLMKKYRLEQEGVWKILGEDPNCDMGGIHSQEDLGTYSGTLGEVLELAFNLPGWASWGGGGDILKVEETFQTAKSKLASLDLTLKSEFCPVCDAMLVTGGNQRYSCTNGHIITISRTK